MIAVELRKLFRRPRTWVTIALLNALQVLVAVLRFLEDHEPDLLAVADTLGIKPQELVAARNALET